MRDRPIMVRTSTIISNLTFDRLNRLGQRGAIFFHLVENSYHANIERLCISKWMMQLFTEIGLPKWIEYELLGEILPLGLGYKDIASTQRY